MTTGAGVGSGGGGGGPAVTTGAGVDGGGGGGAPDPAEVTTGSGVGSGGGGGGTDSAEMTTGATGVVAVVVLRRCKDTAGAVDIGEGAVHLMAEMGHSLPMVKRVWRSAS